MKYICYILFAGKLLGHLFTIVDIAVNEKDQQLISLSTARVRTLVTSSAVHMQHVKYSIVNFLRRCFNVFSWLTEWLFFRTVSVVANYYIQ